MCPTVQELSAYYDGRADPARAEAVAAHARECPACAAELSGFRDLSSWLTGAGRAPPPADALRRLGDHVDRLAGTETPATLGTFRRVGRVLSGVAAAVVVAGAAGLYLRQSESPSAATPAGKDDWELVALADDPPAARPLPGIPARQTEEARLVEWVVAGLAD